MRIVFIVFFVFLFYGCAHRHSTNPSDQLALICLTDRHGATETISNKERLTNYEAINFDQPQHYQQVIRVFNKNEVGVQKSVLTSYHENGQIKQYLEAVSSRAQGIYKEWHANGKLKIHGHVIEGIAQLTENAQLSWVFDGDSTVFDEQGQMIAHFCYDKGLLQGDACYYYPNGIMQKCIPYVDHQREGICQSFDKQGHLIGSETYHQDVLHGEVSYQACEEHPAYEERYDLGNLIEGKYYDYDHVLKYEIQNGFGLRPVYQKGNLSQEVEFKNGKQEGEVKLYAMDGFLENIYHVKNGQRQGEEWVYSRSHLNSPKLYLHWDKDHIHGLVKTWYDNGRLESQREMAYSQKQGMLTAWYRNGDLMCVEEYENDKLMRGKYYKIGKLEAVSSIENGTGTVTLYDENGIFTQRVQYKNSEIVKK